MTAHNHRTFVEGCYRCELVRNVVTEMRGCTVPPGGWWCSREAGHEGPCAARPLPAEHPDYETVEYANDRIRELEAEVADLRDNKNFDLVALVGRLEAEVEGRTRKIARLGAQLSKMTSLHHHAEVRYGRLLAHNEHILAEWAANLKRLDEAERLLRETLEKWEVGYNAPTKLGDDIRTFLAQREAENA